MRSLLATALAAVLLVPASGAADPLKFYVTEGELEVSFGLSPFTTSGDVVAGSSNIGSASLVSGPLLDIDAGAGFTDYSYGAGTLVLSLTVEDIHDPSNSVTGNYVAVTDPFSFSVCEGCDVMFGGGNARDFEIRFAGLFDANLAHALGVAPLADGLINFGLEDIDGGPLDNVRIGFDHRGYAELKIDTVEAPEPGLLLLMMAGGAGWMARRKSRRA